MLHAIVGLGANLADPPGAFVAAIDGIAGNGEVVALSGLWRTRPVGPAQPEYVNAAALIAWRGDPAGLLARCRALEIERGRDRTAEVRWGPRTLDLDLLIFDDLVWRGPELIVPHPHFHHRAFALVPAAEVAPTWIHPFVGRSISELADEVRAADPGAVTSGGPWPDGLRARVP
jgi:2-amino-4-hydroxy-6-hydroxymethyldihydropteridine diphosphokinase